MKYKRRDNLTGTAFLLPSSMGVLVFFLLPFGVVMYYSVVNGPKNSNFVFLDNYRQLFKNPAFLLAAKNTAIFSTAAVALGVVLSLVLALLVESRLPFRGFFRTVFLSPLMVPVISVVLVTRVAFDFNGAVNSWLGVLGLGGVDWLNTGYSRWIVMAMFLWKNLGYNMILFIAALNNVPNEVLESAQVDGAGYFRRFFQIKLRYLSPAILFVGIITLLNSFRIFREVYLLSGQYPYSALYTLQHFMNNTFKMLDYQKLSSAAIVMSAVITAILALLFWLESRFRKDVEG
ncbi:MAG: sugar ABC transporter permease [Lentisphaerae bacterium]|nr:sugar ABC transporter permease [Lentisphaerota bacterium]